MEKEQYIVAIEICSSKIIGAVATKSPSGAVAIVALEEEKLVDCVRFGCIQNVEETNTRISRIIKKLENRSSISPRKIKGVFVGIGGRSLRNIVSDVESQFKEETTITDRHIEAWKKESRSVPIAGFEILDVVPRKFIIDRVDAKNPYGMIGSHVASKFNLIIAKPNIKANIKRVIEERLQLSVKGYIVTPLCTAEYVLSYDERQLGCMLVDFGAETTTVSIYKNDVLAYISTLPIGSRNITRDIATLNVLEETAEEMKKTVGNALVLETEAKLRIEGLNSSDVSNYVVARSGEIAANIIAQLDYAEYTLADIPGGIILVGGGAKLNGLADLIAQQTKVKVRKGAIASHINILDNKAEGLEYVQVVSIAAKGAELIAPDDSCCIAPTVPISAPAPAPVQTPISTKEVPKKPKSPSRFKGLLDKLKNSAEGLFAESEETEENDNK